MCGRWFVAMSRTKARMISSLRMRRCIQRRNKTNCAPTEKMAARMPYQWEGIEKSYWERSRSVQVLLTSLRPRTSVELEARGAETLHDTNAAGDLGVRGHRGAP